MTNPEELLEAQKEIHQKMDAMRVELKALGERLFSEGSKLVFAEFPEVESFSWTQYTPYFNDGDPCEFSVHDYYTVELKNGDTLEDVYYSPYRIKRAAEEGEELDLENRLAQTLYNLVGNIDEDTMKALFGDHAKITVTREGIDVEEYEHD